MVILWHNLAHLCHSSHTAARCGETVANYAMCDALQSQLCHSLRTVVRCDEITIDYGSFHALWSYLCRSIHSLLVQLPSKPNRISKGNHWHLSRLQLDTQLEPSPTILETNCVQRKMNRPVGASPFFHFNCLEWFAFNHSVSFFIKWIEQQESC